MKLTIRNLLGIVLSTLMVGCAPIVQAVMPLQPGVATDSPNVWVAVKTDDEKVNGVYRCTDDGKTAVCRRAALQQ